MQIKRSNENDLIQQTLAGDTAAFDRLVKIYRTTIYMLVLSYIKNPADAEDLTQRIFIRAYDRLATLRDPNCFLPWLQRIAENICKNWMRRQGDSTPQFETLNDTDFAATAPSPEDIALKREIEAVVREAINALKEPDRKLMQARYIEGASYEQLQVESGLSYAAIANRLKRAKQQIRRRIEKLLGGMAILPGQTLIFGGIETVKLSTTMKLAAVGVAAVLAIGGGGAMYHHTSESNPVSESRSVVVNEQEGQESQSVPGGSSPTTPHQTDTTANSNAPTDGVEAEANRLSTDRMVADVQFEDSIYSHSIVEGVKLDLVAGDILTLGGVKPLISDGKMVNVVESELTEDMLAQLPEAIREVTVDVSSGGHSMALKIVDGDHKGNLLLVTSDELQEKIESGEVKIPYYKSTTADTPSAATDSVLSPSGTATIESTTASIEPSESPTPLSNTDWAEFEKLVSDFSDADWAEFERLLRAAVETERPQQNKQRSLAPKQQRLQQVIEKVGEKTPITASVLQELQKPQRRVLPQRDTNAPPRPKDAERSRER